MTLTVENISISYDQRPVLDKLSFSVKKNEFVSLIGPSGCGKSTLLNIISGLIPKEEGAIYVDGEAVCGLSPHFTYMPQNDLLMPWKTVLENVCLHAIIHGNGKAAKKEALRNMDKFGLRGYENSYPEQLSGGMRQRAAFLRTALCPAQILLLDEPFAALDVITKENMQDWLMNMRKVLSRTIVLVTHDIDEAIYLSDRIVVLSGRPAAITNVYSIHEANRSREWLFSNSKLKSQIYAHLRENNATGQSAKRNIKG